MTKAEESKILEKLDKIEKDYSMVLQNHADKMREFEEVLKKQSFEIGVLRSYVDNKAELPKLGLNEHRQYENGTQTEMQYSVTGNPTNECLQALRIMKDWTQETNQKTETEKTISDNQMRNRI